MTESNINETRSNQIRPSGNPGDASAGEARRPYTPPRLLSSEPLELSAGTCDPAYGGFGKSYPSYTCQKAGS